MTLAVLDARQGPLAVLSLGENTALAARDRRLAEIAANTVLAAGNFIDGGQAAAEAATSEGDFFSYSNGAGGLVYAVRNAVGSTEIAQAATKALVDTKVAIADLASPDDGKGVFAVGFRQSGTGAVDSNAGEKLLQYVRTARDFDAAIDGATDARAAIATVAALGPIEITPGLYLIGSNLTFTNHVKFFPGARFVIPNGVTVTFAGGLDAPAQQIFNLSETGAVAGLGSVNVAWFAGDIGTSGNAVPSIQKALDACTVGAEVLWDRAYLSDGSAYLQVSKAQNVYSPGRTKGRLLWTANDCRGFRLSAIEGASIRGIGFAPQEIYTIPLAGDAVLVEAVNCVVAECYSTHCYGGTHWKNINGGKDVSNKFNGSTGYSNWIDNSPNIEITNANCSAFSDWVDVSTTAGFIPGESITFASGGDGAWGYTTSGARAKIIINDRSPAIGTVITGSTSGATCTLGALNKGHQVGGLLLTGNAAGFNIAASAWAGGVKSGACDATVDAHGTRPEYGAIVSSYFDHADEGFQLIRGAGIRFAHNWCSARFGDGLRDTGTHNMFIGNTISHSWNNGFLLGGHHAVVSANVVQGNNRSNNGKAGIYVLAGTSDFTITTTRIGGGTAAGFDGTQARPIIVEAGSSDRYVIRFNPCSGNANNAIVDGGTGVNKSVGDNF